MPGQQLAAVAANGTPDLTLTASALGALGYTVVASALAVTAFRRRDITA